MSDHILVRLLLLPFSVIFGAGVWIRNHQYRLGILKSISFSFPVIGVGNLSVGGTGKTPHTAQILRYLSPHLKVAGRSP